MIYAELYRVQCEQGWTDTTLLGILRDWLEVQPEETKARCLRYVEGRTAKEEDDEDHD